ncbi:MAG: ATP-binding cassette domain-containing protein, partial [Planctomycetes bacterium]|nr:ATP-binding cassette domain-containing protein [Planctomycetota bacterium]
GKTTIINLICRFYDAQRGEVLIDGVNGKDYNKRELREMLGLVLQDVFLFAGSVLENLRLGNAEISDSQVRRGAELAGAAPFIEKLEGGFQAPVAERGATFSTGQKQLIAFARALAYDPKILILDEATANIDSETEALIQQAIENSMRGRTTVAVAHRLSTIRHADMILVLDHGEIVERGSHDELIKQQGKYYRLYTLQFQEETTKKRSSGRTPSTKLA